MSTNHEAPRDELQRAVLNALLEVAPDIDPSRLDPAGAIRDQFDFDSMDQLSFVTALHKSFGIDIPEPDYAQLSSLEDCVRYIEARLAEGGS